MATTRVLPRAFALYEVEHREGLQVGSRSVLLARESGEGPTGEQQRQQPPGQQRHLHGQWGGGVRWAHLLVKQTGLEEQGQVLIENEYTA